MLGRLLTLGMIVAASALVAQEKTTSAAGIGRTAGTEAASQIQYVELALKGSGSGPVAAPGMAPPVLTAQCSLRPNGKYVFELFSSLGEASDVVFDPPWKPASKDDLFPPRTEKVTMTMEFLGYTKVKPARKQWEIPVHQSGQYRYSPPGAGSPNLEEAAYYLRYLLALPTLRLTAVDASGKHSAEFMTTPLLDAIRKEPLCRAAAL